MQDEIERLATRDAPQAIGPYCQATRFGQLLFCSGQLPLHPQTGALIEADIAQMTLRCLENLAAVCAAAGTSLDQALRLTVYVCDLGRFKEVNAAYASFFADVVPARSTVQVAALPVGAPIEIDAIVAIP